MKFQVVAFVFFPKQKKAEIKEFKLIRQDNSINYVSNFGYLLNLSITSRNLKYEMNNTVDSIEKEPDASRYFKNTETLIIAKHFLCHK